MIGIWIFRLFWIAVALAMLSVSTACWYTLVMEHGYGIWPLAVGTLGAAVFYAFIARAGWHGEGLYEDR
jgi:hypothetical protein